METDGHPLELKLFARRVTLGVVFVCGVLFVGGIRLSGVDLDRIDQSSRTFSPGDHVCVRSEGLSVPGESSESYEICVEWIDLKDTSGRIHYLDPDDLDISVGPGGKIRVRGKSRINFRLLGLITYLLILIIIGNAIQTRLIGRRRKEIEARNLKGGFRHSI